MIGLLKNTSIQICKPVSPQHEKGMLWFWNLASAVETTVGDSPMMVAPAMLARSREFYNLYIQTGETRYLVLCEDFLRHSLGTHRPVHAAE